MQKPFPHQVLLTAGHGLRSHHIHQHAFKHARHRHIIGFAGRVQSLFAGFTKATSSDVKNTPHRISLLGEIGKVNNSAVFDGGFLNSLGFKGSLPMVLASASIIFLHK
jgi:hypothetical protein